MKKTAIKQTKTHPKDIILLIDYFIHNGKHRKINEEYSKENPVRQDDDLYLKGYKQYNKYNWRYVGFRDNSQIYLRIFDKHMRVTGLLPKNYW